jgi:ribonuclease HI
MNAKNMLIWVDGAARGNPGPAAIGVVVKDEQGTVLARLSKCIGETTNNQAEYRALIAALEKAVELGARKVSVYSDSELVVRQITGRYRVKKEELKPLFQKATQLQSRLENFSISHIPRSQNAAADGLANEALDGNS